MMESVGFEKGLVRYASENGIANHEKLHYTRRMKMYTALLIILTGLLTTLLVTRKDITATVMRTPGLLFQEKGTDSISNLYNIKVVNKTVEDIPLTVKLEDANGTVQLVGNNIHVQKEGQGAGSFFITLPKSRITQRKTVLQVGLYQGDKKIDVVKTSFLGPLYSNN
jgi:polyferredoxin